MIRQLLAYPFPLPGAPHPTYYLSDEASQKRIAALVDRLVADPSHPDYIRVPPRIQRLVDARRQQEAA